MNSGGMTFDLLFDAAAMAAPASFSAGIEQAASMLSSTISDKITVNHEHSTIAERAGAPSPGRMAARW